jgi:hypothetical protein
MEMLLSQGPDGTEQTLLPLPLDCARRIPPPSCAFARCVSCHVPPPVPACVLFARFGGKWFVIQRPP